MSQVPLTCDRIARTARLLRYAIFAAVAIVVGSHLVLLAPTLLPHVQVRTAIPGMESMPLLIAVRLVGAVLFVVALWQLVQMLGAIETGALFSTRVTQTFRRFALLLLISVAVTTLAPPLLSLIVPCATSATCRTEILIDTRGILMLLIVALFFLVARLLDEARRIDDENREIV